MGDSGAARQLQRLEWYWHSPQARLPHTPPRASPPRFRRAPTCCPSTSTASWMACSTTRRTPLPRRPPRSPRPRKTLTNRSRAARRGNLPLPLRRSLRSPPRLRHLRSQSPPRLRPPSPRCPRPASRRSPRPRPPPLKCPPPEVPAAEVPAAEVPVAEVPAAEAPAGSVPSSAAPTTPSTAAASPTATGGPATASADPRSGSTSMEATSTRQPGGPSPLLGLGIGLVALSLIAGAVVLRMRRV